LRPRLILTPNWISRFETFYLLWSKKNITCDFVVVQHGSYIGGKITEESHKNIKCGVFLVWGNYFKETFQSFNYNHNKRIEIIGNTIYNQINRKKFKYSEPDLKEILIITSGVTEKGSKVLSELVKWLEENNILVWVKFHNHQVKKFGRIDGYNELNDDLYITLKSERFKLVIADHSTALLDSIFFKKYVIFFPQSDRGYFFKNNLYSEFLPTLEPHMLNQNNDLNFLSTFIDKERQELFFKKLISIKPNIQIEKILKSVS
jgi:hypothetical protein